MIVNDIFESISGEAGLFPQGQLCTFLRLQGCNLQCNWCFGVIPGRRIPKIIYSRGPNKKITEVVIGDKLMTFDTNGQIAETEVISVMRRTVNSWIRVTIEGTQYFVTKEHPFFTTRGMITAENLKKGDCILHATFQQKIAFQKTLVNPMWNTETAKKSSSHTDYEVMGKNLAKTIARKQQTGTYQSSWDKLTEDQKQKIRKKISISKLGSKNPNWKGALKKNYEFLKKEIREGRIRNCTFCDFTVTTYQIKPGAGVGLDVHHLDENCENDTWSNLKVLCESCHSTQHKIGYNFWKSERSDKKQLHVKNGFKVEEIKWCTRKIYPPSQKQKPLNVFNFTCAPYNTYLVDNMWVHNCDTAQSQPATGGYKLTTEAVAKKIRSFGNRHILITGGEPLMQKAALVPLLTALQKEGMLIQIETNGSYFPGTADVWKKVLFVVDYKLPSSGMCLKMPAFNKFSEGWAPFTYRIKFVIDLHNKFDVSGLLHALKVFQDGYCCQQPFLISPMDAKGKNIPALIKLLKQERLAKNIVFSVQIHKILKLK